MRWRCCQRWLDGAGDTVGELCRGAEVCTAAHESWPVVNLAAVHQLVQQPFHHWLKNYAPSMGSALAYNSFFSMAPLLLLVIAVTGLVFGQDATSGHLMHELSGLVGAEAAASIQAIVASVDRPAQSWVAALVSAGVVLVGAMDRIWQAPARPNGGVMALFRGPTAVVWHDLGPVIPACGVLDAQCRGVGAGAIVERGF